MSPIETKRTAAIKVADALNSIEGVPVSAFAKEAKTYGILFSAIWAKVEITGADMKAALIAKHDNKLVGENFETYSDGIKNYPN